MENLEKLYDIMFDVIKKSSSSHVEYTEIPLPVYYVNLRSLYKNAIEAGIFDYVAGLTAGSSAFCFRYAIVCDERIKNNSELLFILHHEAGHIINGDIIGESLCDEEREYAADRHAYDVTHHIPDFNKIIVDYGIHCFDEFTDQEINEITSGNFSGLEDYRMIAEKMLFEGESEEALTLRKLKLQEYINSKNEFNYYVVLK